ncbi:hypothetical protein L2E82_48140 [Cichorium intybus]|uniref:Uncharacterized protein n=1 Tax=Cichorium intybus TaxID=13427 RepID=A0ACB8YYP3_CICIN|nr:hypothetical protein L2E82_48140 [Cichorium intybus]
MLRQFSSRKTTLMFVIRDKTRTPLENLEPVLREDIQKVIAPRMELIIFFPHDGENEGSEDHQSSPVVYEKTDEAILSHDSDLGRGGSTSVTAVLINGQRLWVANLGHSRAVLLKGGEAIQMSTDHEPTAETVNIAHKGVFISNMPVQMMPKIPPNEEICLRYRCLDLRIPQMSSNIMLTHQIETPILSRLTLEGAGSVVGPGGLDVVSELVQVQVETVAQFGVIFLHFALGLEFSMAKVSYLAADGLFPEWKIWTQFLDESTDESTEGLRLDGLSELHPIEGRKDTGNEIISDVFVQYKF